MKGDDCPRDGIGYCLLALNGNAACFIMQDEADPAWGARECDKMTSALKLYRLADMDRGASNIIPIRRKDPAHE